MSISVDVQPGTPSFPVTVQTAPPPALSRSLPYPQQVSRRGLWRYAVPLVLGHALALLAFAPWLFSWSGAALLWAGIYFYGGIGIDLCYHRLLTHRSFRCPLWLERIFVLVAL